MIFNSKSKNILGFLTGFKKYRSSFVALKNTNESDIQSSGTSHLLNDAELTESEFPYYVEDGLRKVYPYYYTHSAFCKGRWIHQNLIDCYSKEFALYPREEYVKRILNGQLKVNGKTVSVDYKLKNKDLIQSRVHRHELPVLATHIHTIYEDDEMLVVDKPPSLPVHPCALYNYNCITNILSLEYGHKNLHVIHRLDRLTSGILIYAKNSEKSRELHNLFNLRDIKKEYVCRVEGNFPDGIIVCNKPIKKVYHKVGINIVNPLGRMCITEFEKLSFNGKSSVVLCKPHTGRTHQIRVHLQYLGHPIINDPLYNSYVFGPQKGKNGVIDKSIEQLMDDLVKEHSTQWWFENSPKEASPFSDIEKDLMDVIIKAYTKHLDDRLKSDRYKKDQSRMTYNESCYFCGTEHRDPKQSHLMMFLHAYKYESNNWKFTTEMPLWAADDWNSF